MLLGARAEQAAELQLEGRSEHLELTLDVEFGGVGEGRLTAIGGGDGDRGRQERVDGLNRRAARANRRGSGSRHNRAEKSHDVVVGIGEVIVDRGPVGDRGGARDIGTGRSILAVLGLGVVQLPVDVPVAPQMLTAQGIGPGVL